MDHEELRLKALEAARAEGASGSALLARAEEIYQWLRYGGDAAADNRRALAGVELKDARTGEARPASVVGRDNDILDRLRKDDGYTRDE